MIAVIEPFDGSLRRASGGERGVASSSAQDGRVPASLRAHLSRTEVYGERSTDDKAVAVAYQQLKTKYGVGAVVNLRSESAEDAAAAKKAGMRFLHLPIADGSAPTPAQVAAFFTFHDAERAKKTVVLWHCAGGIGRTGVLAGMLRLRAGWSAEDAGREMFAMGLNQAQAVEHLPALNNFAQALGKPAWWPAGWPTGKTSPHNYAAVAKKVARPLR